jgi:hypothetical protein
MAAVGDTYGTMLRYETVDSLRELPVEITDRSFTPIRAEYRALTARLVWVELASRCEPLDSVQMRKLKEIGYDFSGLDNKKMRGLVVSSALFQRARKLDTHVGLTEEIVSANEAYAFQGNRDAREAKLWAVGIAAARVGDHAILQRLDEDLNVWLDNASFDAYRSDVAMGLVDADNVPMALEYISLAGEFVNQAVPLQLARRLLSRGDPVRAKDVCQRFLLPANWPDFPNDPRYLAFRARQGDDVLDLAEEVAANIKNPLDSAKLLVTVAIATHVHTQAVKLRLGV